MSAKDDLQKAHEYIILKNKNQPIRVQRPFQTVRLNQGRTSLYTRHILTHTMA